jgi:putative transposase
MYKAELKSCVRDRRKRTICRDGSVILARDVVRQNFTVMGLIGSGCRHRLCTKPIKAFLYLAFVLYAHSRRLVGWAMEIHHRTELIIDALCADGGLAQEAISGSDPPLRTGYAIHLFVLRQEACGGLHRPHKTELLYRGRWPTREPAMSVLFEYLEAFYNRRRLHSSLGYRNPESFEETAREEATVA